MDFSGTLPSKGGGTSTTFSERDVRTAFDQFDLDKNGYLGASDISSIFRAIGEELDDDMIDELIREADHDGDGQIAFSEFKKLVKDLEFDAPKRSPRVTDGGDSTIRPQQRAQASAINFSSSEDATTDSQYD